MNKVYSIIIAAGLTAGTAYGADTWLKVPSPKALPKKAAQVVKGLLSGLPHAHDELAHLRAEINADKQSLSYNMYCRRLFADHKPFKIYDDAPYSPPVARSVVIKKLAQKELVCVREFDCQSAQQKKLSMLPPSAFSVLGREYVKRNIRSSSVKRVG